MATLTITFGPSRSPDYPRALAYARRYADSLEEIEPGRWRATFDLGTDTSNLAGPSRYGTAWRLLDRARTWRSTEVDVAGEPERKATVLSMLSCARDWLRARGTCEERFWNGQPYSRCMCCPLLAQRGIVRAPDHIPAGWA